MLIPSDSSKDDSQDSTCNAPPNLVIDAEIRRLIQRAEQCERLMCKAIHRGQPDVVQRYNRLAAAACAACLELLTG